MSDEILAQNTEEESTISQEPETQQEVELTAEADAAPQDSESAEDTTAKGTENSDGAEAEAAPFLEIQYNHQKRGLSRTEAAALAQKGIHYESAYNILERVATLRGISVEEFLNGIEKAQDEAYRQSLTEQFGDDENTVNAMMELYEIKKQQTLDGAAQKRRMQAAQAQQTQNERLAREFVAMKKDFPELDSFALLPEAVKKAAGEGMSLSHAYLLHMHRENQKIAAAKQSAENAARKSTGSMAAGVSDDSSEVGVRYINALWSR